MNTRFLPLLIIPLVASCATTPSPSSIPELPRQAIEAANRELMARYNRGDKLGVARMYEDSALMISADGERHQGRAAIDAYWNPKSPTDRPASPSTWSLNVLSLEGTDAMPIQRGRSVLSGEWNGKPSVSDVQFLVIWRKQHDGSYKIAVDAWWPTEPK